MPSLAQLLRAASAQGVPFESRAACAIAGQLCAGLDRSHGGLTPQIIHIGWDGAVSVSRSAPTPSALAYMAPERLAGRGPEQSSDLYALAAILFEMVVGRALPRPGDAQSARAVSFAGDIPVELIDIIERATSRDPRGRYASAREMAAWLSLAGEESGGAMGADDLAAWLAARFPRESPGPRPVGPAPLPRSRLPRKWKLGAAAGLVAGAGVLVAALIMPGLVGASQRTTAPAAVDASPVSRVSSHGSAMAARPAAPVEAVLTAAPLAPLAARASSSSAAREMEETAAELAVAVPAAERRPSRRANRQRTRAPRASAPAKVAAESRAAADSEAPSLDVAPPPQPKPTPAAAASSEPAACPLNAARAARAMSDARRSRSKEDGSPASPRDAAVSGSLTARSAAEE